VETVPGRRSFFGQSPDQSVSGSGVFISDEGYILSNNHVVEGTTTLSIILSDGSQQEARIVGTDRYADLAVLKTDNYPAPLPGVANRQSVSNAADLSTYPIRL
jgi:S1-C subfamily serine protease